MDLRKQLQNWSTPRGSLTPVKPIDWGKEAANLLGYTPVVGDAIGLGESVRDVVKEPKNPYSYLGLAATMLPGVVEKPVKNILRKIKVRKKTFLETETQGLDDIEAFTDDQDIGDRLVVASRDKDSNKVTRASKPGEAVHGEIPSEYDHWEDGFVDIKTNTFFTREQAAALMGRNNRFIPKEGLAIGESYTVSNFNMLDGLYGNKLAKNKESQEIVHNAIRQNTRIPRSGPEFDVLSKQMGREETEEILDIINPYTATADSWIKYVQQFEGID